MVTLTILVTSEPASCKIPAIFFNAWQKKIKVTIINIKNFKKLYEMEFLNKVLGEFEL